MLHKFELDVLNPGEVLACCGLAALTGGTTHFEYSGSLRSPNATFILDTDADLDAILSGKVSATELPLADEELKLIQPTLLQIGAQKITLDWWMNFCRSDKSPLKLWCGSTTPSGILQTAIKGLKKPFDLNAFIETKTAKSVLGFDSRTTVERETLQIGFSGDEEKEAVRIYPWVEVLAAVGIQTFRPVVNGAFEYFVWQNPLPLDMARVALGTGMPGTDQIHLTAEILSPDEKLKKLLPAVLRA